VSAMSISKLIPPELSFIVIPKKCPWWVKAMAYTAAYVHPQLDYVLTVSCLQRAHNIDSIE